MSQTPTKPNRGPVPGIPRWVKVAGMIFLALVLLFIILHLTGNGLGGHHMPLGAVTP